jgi:hypothetical protein
MRAPPSSSVWSIGGCFDSPRARNPNFTQRLAMPGVSTPAIAIRRENQSHEPIRNADSVVSTAGMADCRVSSQED